MVEHSINWARSLALGFCLLTFLPHPTTSYASPQTDSESRLAVFVSGISGNSKIRRSMKRATTTLRDVLLANGYGEDEVILFSETPKPDSGWTNHRKSEVIEIETFLAQFDPIGKKLDEVFVFIAGHANGRDEESMLHLPGRDATYVEAMAWVERIPARKLIVVVVAPQGHVWIERLSGEGRTIIVGNTLREFDFIPRVFLHLFPFMFEVMGRTREAGSARQVSLADVFKETQKRVQYWFWSNELHPTELAAIDADGDGEGDSLFIEGEDFGAIRSLIQSRREELVRLYPKGTKLAPPDITDLYQLQTMLTDDLPLKLPSDLPLNDSSPDALLASQIQFQIPMKGQVNH